MQERKKLQLRQISGRRDLDEQFAGFALAFFWLATNESNFKDFLIHVISGFQDVLTHELVTNRVLVPDLETGNMQIILTHWNWDKMAAISQMTFWKAFSWMKIVFWLIFHWNLFPRSN